MCDVVLGNGLAMGWEGDHGLSVRADRSRKTDIQADRQTVLTKRIIVFTSHFTPHVFQSQT